MLVTGGAGFIGSHLVDRLISDGFQVQVLDQFSTGNSANLNKVSRSSNLEIVEGSILDERLLQKMMKDTDYVFHLAAAVGVFNIVSNPLNSMLTNIRGTENVLRFADEFRVPVFLTSSSEVYGKNKSDSLSEDSDRILGSPTTLRWSYSESKAIDESLAYAYYKERDLQIRIARFFNTVGPRQLGSYGMVIPRFIKSALSNEPLTIFGNGNQTRCFAHVQDVVDAVILVAFSDKTIGKVLNIGNNKEISMNSLAKMVISQTGSESEIAYLPYEQAYGVGFEDMERRVPNTTLIKELVGWEARLDLARIIDDISAEMQKNS